MGKQRQIIQLLTDQLYILTFFVLYHILHQWMICIQDQGRLSAEQTRYLVFFKGRDADVMTAAFQEFSAKKLNRDKKPSIRKALAAAKDKAKQLNAARDKVKKIDRGREI